MVRLAAVLLAGVALPSVSFAATCAERLTPRPAPSTGSRAITAADLIELRDFGDSDGTPMTRDMFTLSPDGRSAALVLRRAEVAANRYCLGLAIVALDSGAIRFADIGGEPILPGHDFRIAEIGYGLIDIPAPRWSPDGRQIAFLRRDAGVTRLWRVDADGGPAHPVTGGAPDIYRFRWSANGKALLYMIRPALAAAREAIAQEGRSGYLYDERFWPMSEAAPRPLPGIPYAYRAIDLATKQAREATPEEAALLQEAPPRPVPPRSELFAQGPAGALAWNEAKVPTAIFGPERLVATIEGQQSECPGDACSRRIIGLWWSDPSHVLFLRDWSGDAAGAIELFAWKPGGAPVSLLRTRDSLMDCQMGGGALICGQERSSAPARIVRIDLATGHVVPMFDPNPEFANLRLGSVTRLPARAADGTGTFADLVLPPDHKPGQRHPLVVVQYQSRGFLRGGTGDEYPIFLLAAHGYAVLSYQRTAHYSNGIAYTELNQLQRINIAGWHDRTRVFTGLQAAVDAAIATGTVDPQAIGITGMSDGASTAIWAILNDPRYRVAALSQCCEDPWPGFYGNGLAYRRDIEAWGYPAPEKDDRGFWSFYSLAAHADTLKTPILMQLADREYRAALQGAGSLIAAGRPVEMYVFPDEYHNKWQPEHRATVYRRSIAWFDFWLRGEDAPPLATEAERERWRTLRSTAAARDLLPQPGLDRDKP
jgi:dienelactone hydrolase